MSCQYAKTFLAIPAQKYSMLFFLPYSVFLPPTPGGLHRRTYQSSVPENQCFFSFFFGNSYHTLSTNSHRNCRLSTSSTRIIFSHHHTAVPSQHPASVSPPPEPALPKVCQCALTSCSALTFSDIVSTLSI